MNIAESIIFLYPKIFLQEDSRGGLFQFGDIEVMYFVNIFLYERLGVTVYAEVITKEFGCSHPISPQNCILLKAKANF